MELKIEEKLRDVLIPLTDEKFAALEDDILRNGCIQPIIVWNGTIVDGHNRYAICQKHGIPFKMVEHDFADMTEARLWVYTSETNKRDATIFQKCEMAMRFKDDVESQALQRILDDQTRNLAKILARIRIRGEPISFWGKWLAYLARRCVWP